MTTAAHAAATKAARGKRPPPNSRRRSRCSRPRPVGSPNSCHAWTTASRGWPTPRTGSAGRWRRSSTASATPSRGVTRWTAQARRAVSPAARLRSKRPRPRSGRGVRCTRHPCRQASLRVSPRRGAGRPHPPAMGALSVIQWGAVPGPVACRRLGPVLWPHVRAAKAIRAIFG